MLTVSLEANFLLDKLIGLVKRIKQTRADEILSPSSKNYRRDSDAIIDNLKKTVLNDSYLSKIELNNKPIKLDKEDIKLTIDDVTPITVSEHLTLAKATVLRFRTYNSLVNMYKQSANSLLDNYSYKLDELIELEKRTDVDIELEATPVIEDMVKSIKRLKTPRQILSRMEPVTFFNNCFIFANDVNDVSPFTVTYKESNLKNKQLKPVTKDDVRQIAQFIVELLTVDRSLNNYVVNTKTQLTDKYRPFLDSLRDTGLHDYVDYILVNTCETDFNQYYTLNTEEGDIIDYVESLLKIISYSLGR